MNPDRVLRMVLRLAFQVLRRRIPRKQNDRGNAEENRRAGETRKSLSQANKAVRMISRIGRM